MAKFLSTTINHSITPAMGSSRISLDIGNIPLEDDMEDWASLLHADGHPSRENFFHQDYHGSSIFRLVLHVIALVLGLGALFAAYDLYNTMHHQPPEYTGGAMSVSTVITSTGSHAITDMQPCGTDPREARFSSCYFDPITISWLPLQCYDFELTKEFLAVQQWQFWPDSTGRQAISLENVMQGLHTELYVHEEYMRQRCVFAWRKLHRAILSASAVDSYVTDWDGLYECEELIKGRNSRGNVLHRVEVQFYSCNVYF